MLRFAISRASFARHPAKSTRNFSFQALWVQQNEDSTVTPTIRATEYDELMPGDVTVRVLFSDVNYKDGKAVMGEPGVIKSYPFIPGIDFVGEVEKSDAVEYSPGAKVVLTGWGVGERHFGGYSQVARVNSQWLVPLPSGLAPADAMTIGTAGLTSMLCVQALEQAGIAPGRKPVLVTGAGGGVGGIAVAILAKLGYDVVAVTGRAELSTYLKELGAADVISREDVGSTKPLAKERWSGVVDTVGGEMLSKLFAEVEYGGAVAACGLAGGVSLKSTVFPFILRGVKLLGVDSVMCPKPQRVAAWDRLSSGALPLDALHHTKSVVSLTDVPQVAAQILKGQVRGRTVVDLSK